MEHSGPYRAVQITFSWAAAAAAAFRSQVRSGAAGPASEANLESARDRAKAWEVDLEEGSWKCEFNHQLINLEWLSYQIPFLNSHAVSLLKILVRDEESTKAEVDLEVGKEWRGRPLLNESGARGPPTCPDSTAEDQREQQQSELFKERSPVKAKAAAKAKAEPHEPELTAKLMAQADLQVADPPETEAPVEAAEASELGAETREAEAPIHASPTPGSKGPAPTEANRPVPPPLSASTGAAPQEAAREDVPRTERLGSRLGRFGRPLRSSAPGALGKDGIPEPPEAPPEPPEAPPEETPEEAEPKPTMQSPRFGREEPGEVPEAKAAPQVKPQPVQMQATLEVQPKSLDTSAAVASPSAQPAMTVPAAQPKSPAVAKAPSQPTSQDASPAVAVPLAQPKTASQPATSPAVALPLAQPKSPAVAEAASEPASQATSPAVAVPVAQPKSAAIVDAITRGAPSPVKATALRDTGVASKAAKVTFKDAPNATEEQCSTRSAAGTAKHAEQGGEPSLQGKTEADDPNEQSAVVVPVWNKELLGYLQCDGRALQPARTSFQQGDLRMLPASWAFTLPESGLDATAVGQWLEGRISWPLCWARIVDGIQRAGTSVRKRRAKPYECLDDGTPWIDDSDINSQARQALVDHMLLTAKPWNLGALAGGLATLPGTTSPLAAFLPCSAPISPEKAVADAFKWFHQGLFQQDASILLVGGHQPLVLSLAYRRLQLKAHPASSGNQRTLLDAAIKLEILRAASLKGGPSRLEELASPVLSELTDHDLLKLVEIQKSHGKASNSAAREAHLASGFDNEDKQDQLWIYLKSLHKLREELRLLQETEFLDRCRFILGLESLPVSNEMLTKAYRKRAKELHPDRQGDTSKEAFQALQDAYEKLCAYNAGVLPTDDNEEIKEQVNILQTAFPSKFPKDMRVEAQEALRSAQMALSMHQLCKPKKTRSLPSSVAKEAERGKKVHGKKRERQTSVKRKDKEGQDRQTGLEEAGSAGLRPPSETQSQAQSAPSEDYQEDLESESCGESDDSENCTSSRWGAVEVGPWRSSSIIGRTGLSLHCAGSVMEAGNNAKNVGGKMPSFAGKATPIFKMIHKELQEGMDGQTIADLLEQANRTQDELEAAVHLGNAARVLGMQSAIEASEYSDNTCHWEPQGDVTGNTLGYQAAEQAAYASLTGAAAVMAMYDGFEEIKRLSANLQRAVRIKSKHPWEVDEHDIEELIANEEKRVRKIDACAASDDVTQRIQLICEYNEDMLRWQKALRRVVSEVPGFLNPVSVVDKETLFSMIAEVLEVLSQRLLDIPSTAETREIEAVLAVIFVATAWHLIASPPSVEARLLRLAALVDVELLKFMLEEWIGTALNSLGERGLGLEQRLALQRRCDQALTDLKRFDQDKADKSGERA
ncbi:unnamed protein product [Durusdinium trenchii]|uniref:J domain-containing protein n=1 Tax=Durusdinium trenchii TaxID=1381693 RepID=A0ABP0MBR3_9DINO